MGTPPPGFKEAFGLNGFETSIGSFGAETTTTFISSTTITQPSTISTTQMQTTTQLLTTTSTPMPPPTTTIPIITSPPPSPRVEEVFIIPENSGLRPVSPPKEFQGSGGFGSHGTVVSSSGGGGNGFGGGGWKSKNKQSSIHNENFKAVDVWSLLHLMLKWNHRNNL